MDFSDKTDMDLRDIIREATEALNNYSNRTKTKVYGLFLPFTGWRYFIEKENAIKLLQEEIEDDLIFGEPEFEGSPYQIQVKYLTDAELEYCRDYKLKTDK